MTKFKTDKLKHSPDHSSPRPPLEVTPPAPFVRPLIYPTKDQFGEQEYSFRLMHYLSRKQPPLNYQERKLTLLKLRSLVQKEQEQILNELRVDFKRSKQEFLITEILPFFTEINHTLKKLKKWMKPRKVKTPLALKGSESRIEYAPKGVVLIIAPWNYPFLLLMAPLLTALAAGNRVILKPSELVPAFSSYMEKMIHENFPQELVRVFKGEAKVAQELLTYPFDHVIFTGSTAVGKLVRKACLEHFTSTTLELGGKSPAVILPGADLKKAAKKLIWGKFLNAGQTCVAPDYILVPEPAYQELVIELKQELASLYGKDDSSRIHNDDYTSIINDKHFERLKKLFIAAQKEGVAVEEGGVFDKPSKCVSPTLLGKVSPTSSLMKDEIFGPLLPIILYQNTEEAIDIIHSHPRPLACYLFSERKEYINEMIDAVSAGGYCINDTLVHLANPNLPFGGQNHSGIGRYHGIHGFFELSQIRPILTRKGFDLIKFLHPPYGIKIKSLIQILVRKLYRFL